MQACEMSSTVTNGASVPTRSICPERFRGLPCSDNRMNLQTHISDQLWEAIEGSYQAGNFSHAVLDALHFVTDTIRQKSGIDADGAALVGQALGGDTPKLRINAFQTETEKNIQRGIEQILRGIYTGIRNPRSHEQLKTNRRTQTQLSTSSITSSEYSMRQRKSLQAITFCKA